MPTGNEHIERALRQYGVRVTMARRSVYEVLAASEGPLSAGQIAERLAGSAMAIDLVTVYRTLETLEQCQIVMRMDRLKEGWRYALRATEHRHTITCSRCGCSSPLAQCQLAGIERSLEESTGYRDIHHSLQFFGTCPNCR